MSNIGHFSTLEKYSVKFASTEILEAGTWKIELIRDYFKIEQIKRKRKGRLKEIHTASSAARRKSSAIPSSELESLAQKACDSVLIVMANHRGGSRLDMLPGILWSIGFIGYGEHAHVVLAVAEANPLADPELGTQDIHRPTFAGIAMVYIDPLRTIAFQRRTGVRDEVRLVFNEQFHGLDS